MKISAFLKSIFHLLIGALATLLAVNLVVAQPSLDDFATITVGNTDQLELGYVLPGFCGIVTPNFNLTAVWQNGIYDLLTGERRTEIKSEFGRFSANGNYFSGSEDGVVNTNTGEQILPYEGFFSTDEKYLVSQGNGVYDLTSKKKLLSIDTFGWISPNNEWVAVENDALYQLTPLKRMFDLPRGIVKFSPNSEYLALWEHGVFDTETGQHLIESSGIIPEFSGDSQYVAFNKDGVYAIKSAHKILSATDDTKFSFSPDSKLVAATGDGVYDLKTGELRFRIGSSDYFPPHFLENSSWLIVNDDAIYDVDTNQKNLLISGFITSFTKDSSLISLDRTGIVETTTGQLKFGVLNGIFAANDKFLLSNVGDIEGYLCAVYGIKGNKWPYRSGIVNLSETTVYTTPNGQPLVDDQQNNVTISDQLFVFAQTMDGEWLRIGNDVWVKSSEVQPISLPEGIPVETS